MGPKLNSLPPYPYHPSSSPFHSFIHDSDFMNMCEPFIEEVVIKKIYIMWHRIPTVRDRQCQRHIKSGREFISVLNTKAWQDNINYTKKQRLTSKDHCNCPWRTVSEEKDSVSWKFDYSDLIYSFEYFKNKSRWRNGEWCCPDNIVKINLHPCLFRGILVSSFIS